MKSHQSNKKSLNFRSSGTGTKKYTFFSPFPIPSYDSFPTTINKSLLKFGLPIQFPDLSFRPQNLTHNLSHSNPLERFTNLTCAPIDIGSTNGTNNFNENDQHVNTSTQY